MPTLLFTSALQPLYSLFGALTLYFQRLAASFSKTPGWGWVDPSGRLMGINNFQFILSVTGSLGGVRWAKGGVLRRPERLSRRRRYARLCVARISTCRASSSVAHVLSLVFRIGFKVARITRFRASEGTGGSGVSCLPRRRPAFLCRQRLECHTHSSAGLRKKRNDQPHARESHFKNVHRSAGNQAGAFTGLRRCVHVLRAGHAQAEHAWIQIHA